MIIEKLRVAVRKIAGPRPFTRLMFLIGPLYGYLIVEILAENSNIGDALFGLHLLNAAWYFILFFLCRLIFGQVQRGCTAAMLVCFLVGYINRLVLNYRGRMLFPGDILGATTLAPLLKGLDPCINWFSIAALGVLAGYLIFLWRSPRLPGWRPMGRKATAALCGLCAGYVFLFFCTPMLSTLGVYTEQWNTTANGFLLNFTAALKTSFYRAPDGYSRAEIEAFIRDYEPQTENVADVTPINIVVVMNESFADFSIYDGFQPTEDVTPFLHSLKEDTIRGTLYSPVTGGGTATVEHEYLTGYSSAFLPAESVAYMLYTEQNTPSIAYMLKNAGYSATAFHPYKGSGWDRNRVWPLLGFDQCLFEESVEAPFIIRDYISDLSDYQKVTELTDSAGGEPIFVFNVTMQNHNFYTPEGKNLANRNFGLPDSLLSKDEGAELYFSLLRQSDIALQKLIEHYQQAEEPTMVVFFGDHQPPLSSEFYEELLGKPLEDLTDEETLLMHQTPFFIWANYDIPERDGLVLSPNYLGVLTMQAAGLPMTGFYDFLWQMYQVLPVLTTDGCLDSDGNVVFEPSMDEEQTAWLQKYCRLCYYAMQDTPEDLPAFFWGSRTPAS